MTLRRLTAWALLAAAGFTPLAGRAAAQQTPPLPARPDSAFSALSNTYKTARGIPATELAAARPHFKAVADYYAAAVSHELVHRAPQDTSLKVDYSGKKIDPRDGRIIPTVDSLIEDLERFVLVPTIQNYVEKRVTAENADYIRELGSALDAALKPVVETHPDRIVRVNAARVYATACKSGAAAHWPTVTALLTNANTPAEVKNYVLPAAGNLLAAYDTDDIKSRRHALVKNPRSAADKEIAQLVAALMECVRNPNALVPGIPGGKLDPVKNPDTAAVVGYIRRQAVKALGQTRFASMPGPDGKTFIHPAYPLVRVCLSDAALVPAPGPAECAEAAIGLCNMAPVWNSSPVKGFNPNAAAEAVTAAMVHFAAKRSEDPADKSLPWRGYALRIGDAVRNWKPLFDPGFDPTAPTKYEASYTPPVITDVVANVQAMIVAPMEKVGVGGGPDLSAPVQIQRLRDYYKQLRSTPKRDPLLLKNAPETTVDMPQHSPDKQ